MATLGGVRFGQGQVRFCIGAVGLCRGRASDGNVEVKLAGVLVK